MYLYTLTISHKSCNMLNILNNSNFKRNCNFLWQIMCFWTKTKKRNNNKTKNQTYKPLLELGIEPGTFCTQCGCVTTAPPSQLKVSIVVRLFNCFDAMGQTVNKQSRICGPVIFNKYMFSLKNLNAWTTMFGSSLYLPEYVSPLKYG